MGLLINGKEKVYTAAERAEHQAMGPRYMWGFFDGEEAGVKGERAKALEFLEAKVVALEGPGENLALIRATLLDACRWLREGEHAPWGTFPPSA